MDTLSPALTHWAATALQAEYGIPAANLGAFSITLDEKAEHYVVRGRTVAAGIVSNHRHTYRYPVGADLYAEVPVPELPLEEYRELGS